MKPKGVEELRRIIESNDQKLKVREQKLIRDIDIAYEKAVKEAIKEFKYLEKLNPDVKPSNSQVKKILIKALNAFQEEYNSLIEPIKKAMEESYGDGLSEAGQILTSLERKGNESKS